MLVAMQAILVRLTGHPRVPIVGRFPDVWRAIFYAEAEECGHMAVCVGQRSYPFTVRPDGQSEIHTDVYEALLAVCPKRR